MDFWEIHDQYYPRIRGFILSLVRDESLADDLVQETFIRIQQNQDRLRDPSKMSSWIFRIAYNLCQDHFRKRKESSLDENGIKEKTGDSEEVGIEKEMEQRQMGECVQDKVNLLPEPLRAVIILFDTMDLSHQEIAESLGITVENVKVRLHRARRKLKAILEEECTFEVDERNVLVCDRIEIGLARGGSRVS
jgi:RNA polymerase sigma-70 factor (ECF subfamily)